MLCHVMLYQNRLFYANPQNLSKPYHSESNVFPIRFDKCTANLQVLQIFIFLLLFLVNDPQALHANPDCLK